MSFPYLSYSCSRCSFTAGDPFFWRDFSYEVPSGQLPLICGLGWCNECMNIAAIEILPTPYMIDKLKTDIEKQKEHIADLNDRLMKSRSWVKKLFDISVSPTSEIENIKWQCKMNESRMLINKRILPFLETRKSKPRCLACGSTDNFIMPNLIPPLKTDYPFNLSEELLIPVKTGYKHPSCGGNLLIEYSGVWLSVVKKHCVYDIEGNFIRQEN